MVRINAFAVFIAPVCGNVKVEMALAKKKLMDGILK
jgi:hypothetical protein